MQPGQRVWLSQRTGGVASSSVRQVCCQRRISSVRCQLGSVSASSRAAAVVVIVITIALCCRCCCSAAAAAASTRWRGGGSSSSSAALWPLAALPAGRATATAGSGSKGLSDAPHSDLHLPLPRDEQQDAAGGQLPVDAAHLRSMCDM
jgi:hypothetical protein